MEPRNQDAGYGAPSQPGDGKKTMWIIGGVVAVIAIIGVIYGATQSSLKKTNSVSGNTSINMSTGDTNQVAAARVTIPVTYTGFDVVNLQTFPYRVQVRVRGKVSEGCVTADVPIATVSGKVFTVAMTGSKPADAMCTQIITNVENVVELPVAGLAAGNYTVKLGTMKAKTFTLAADNKVQFSGDK